MTRKTAAVLSVILAFFVFSCGSKQQSAARVQEAMMMKASGLVEISAAEGWRKAVAGDKLTQGMKVRTGPASYCDIRTGSENLVRLKADSLLELKTLFADAQNEIEKTVLGLDVGTILAKPKKMLKDSSYEIETPTAVAGVRGTEFLVSADAKANTTVAVQEGTVALTPRLESAAAGDATSEPVAAAVRENAKLLTAGQQAVLKEESVRKLDADIAKAVSEGDASVRAPELLKAGAANVTVTPVSAPLKRELKEIRQIVSELPAAGVEPVGTKEAPSAAKSYSEAWKIQADTSIVSSAAVSGGLTVLAAKDGTLVAVDASGATKWAFETGASADSSPTAVSGKILMSSGDENLYCLNAADGRKLWSVKAGRASYARPVTAGDTVFVGSVSGQLTALSLDTGSQLWQFSCQSGIYSSACVSGDRVYVGSEDYSLYCLDRQTGKKIWAFKTGNRIISASPVASGGLVFVGSLDGNLYAVSESTGNEVWRQSLGDKILASVSISGPNLFIGANNGRFAALDAMTGKVLWQKELGSSVESPALLLPSGKAVVATRDGSLFVLSTQNGASLWKGSFGSRIAGQPALQSGNAVFGTVDGKVHSVRVTW